MTDTATQEPLVFAQSDSKTLGAEGSFMDTLKDNGPQVIGGLRLAGLIAAAMTGNEFLVAHTMFVLASEVVLLMFAHKDKIQEARETTPDETDPNVVEKVAQPHKYPLETSAALDFLGELSHIGFGAQLMGWLGGGAEAPDVPSTTDALLDDAEEGRDTCPEGLYEHKHGEHVHCSFTPQRPAFLPDEPIDATESAEAATDTTEDTHDHEAEHGHGHDHDHFKQAGLIGILHGGFGVLAPLPLLLFGPEKDKKGHGHSHLDLTGEDFVEPEASAQKREDVTPDDGLVFQQSESQTVGTKGDGILGWIQDHQVMISSVLEFGLGMTMLFMPGAALPGNDEWYRIGGAIIATAAALQPILITKRDYSAERAPEDAIISESSHEGVVQQNQLEQRPRPL